MADSSSPTGQDPAQNSSSKTGGQSPIPAAILQKYPDLEALIMQTESMTEEERQYWFQIMPIMTDEQVQKLRGILIHEKEQLAKLDTQYEAELSKLNEKHVLEWKAQEQQEKREALKKAETSHEAEEKAAEAALLQQLDDVDA